MAQKLRVFLNKNKLKAKPPEIKDVGCGQEKEEFFFLDSGLIPWRVKRKIIKIDIHSFPALNSHEKKTL